MLVSLSMILGDIAVFDTQMLETSLTEITQELMLFVCALVFWHRAGIAGQRGLQLTCMQLFWVPTHP